MAKRSQSIPIEIHRGRRRSHTMDGGALLADLKERFAQFRAEHARGTRVPVELRAATVAASRAGVAAGDLYRACGISWAQLEAWKAGQPRSIRPRPRRRRVVAPNVRAFSVVDPGSSDPGRSAEHDLELRFGRWSLRIRLVEPARGE